jgi:hypothetical protein
VSLTYKGQPPEAWFYANRTGFFSESARKSRQKAIDELGTNAFPSLLSVLTEERGSGTIYFRVHRSLPRFAQSKLPYALLGDDIKLVALDHLGQMRSLTSEHVRSLAQCIPQIENPRVRMQALGLVLRKHQSNPVCLELCRELLNDPHPGIQLEAAIHLAQYGLQADPDEPRLFPLLMGAMDSKQRRQEAINIQSYTFREVPPGGTGNPFTNFPPALARLVVDHDLMLRREIMRGLDRLQRHLSIAQQEQINELHRQRFD